MIMLLQRAWDKLRTGERLVIKWAAEGAVNGESLVACDVRHTSVAGDMIVSC